LTGRHAGSAADLEAGQSDRLLVTDSDPFDLGVRRARLAPAAHLRHRIGIPLEHGLDRAVAAVAHPAGNTGLLGLLATGVAEEHALHVSVDDDPGSDHGTNLPSINAIANGKQPRRHQPQVPTHP